MYPAPLFIKLETISNSTTLKENKMMKQINLGALLALADSVTNDEIKREFKLDMVPAGIKEALVTIKAEKAKAATIAAATEIYSLLECSETRKQALVQSIRVAREVIEKNKSQLADIAAAEKYGSESSNFLPLYKAVGFPTHVLRGEDVAKQNLFTIPNTRKEIKIVKRVINK